MKKTIMTLAVLGLSAVTALAQTVNTDTSSNSQSQSGSQAVVQQIYGKGHRTASSAIAPGLIASGLSCSGSAVAGGAGGGWGISLGITKQDKDCNIREDAKYVHGVTGDQGAAKEVLCDNPRIRAAFARAGRPCAADMTTYSSVRQAAPEPQRVSSAGSYVDKNRNIKLEACMKRAAKDPTVRCRVYQ